MGDHDMTEAERADSRHFDIPTDACDLIMEGGLTSGVVYPLALVKLAERYKFRCIGGTSAGAIAAAIAAAAEHCRESGSFQRLSEIPNELSKNLLSLFQPTPRLRGIFNAFLAALNHPSRIRKIFAAAGHLALALWWAVLIGALPAIIYPWAEWSSVVGALLNLFGIVAIFITITLLVGYFVIRLLRRELRATVFGFCPGLTQKGNKLPALTDWLTDTLDALAGLPVSRTSEPLKFGDLRTRNITLQMMTTNLSMRRPYRLPMNPTGKGDEPQYAFRKSEWEQFFPARVMEQLITREVPGANDLFWLPEPDDLPVIVAVRMSLSFPVLLSAIPLYAKDRTFRHDPAQIKIFRRCVFSDGGITSNFPIHFFDSMLPSRPTFAISLEDWVEARHGPDSTDPQQIGRNRVRMPRTARQGINLPINPIQDLFGFLASIVASARVWQDQLQSVLPGYRERIANVALNDEEGGINLNMPPPRVKALTRYGEIAGTDMLGFDMDEHRWRRFLVTFARLEESFEQIHDAYDRSYREFLVRYPDQAKSYKPVSQKWMQTVRERMNGLCALIETWRDDPLRHKGEIPRPASVLRITPEP
jgi:predicted acylesterase/phospholipase RssA